MEAADRLGYRPNAIARSMATGTTHTIGVVLADVANPFFSSVLRGISDTMKAHGYDAIVLNTDEKLAREKDAIDVLLDKQVDGIVISSAADRDAAVPHIEAATSRGIPVVLVDRQLETVSLDQVVVNNREVSAAAVAELIGCGHERIGFVWGPVTIEPATDIEAMYEIVSHALWSDGERLLGYLDAITAAGLPFDTALVSHVLKTEQQAERAVSGMLSLKDPPTAVFATETDAVVGTLRAIRRAGLRCPQDVSVIGFDDSPWATLVEPPLTIIDQPVHELGATAAQRLLSRLRDNSMEATTIVLPARYIARGSVAAGPAAPAASAAPAAAS
jgi:LacI family transcriptional regulator